MSSQGTSVTVLAVRPRSTGFKTFFFFADVEAMLQVYQASPIFANNAFCEQGCTYTCVLTQAFN
jgi:hypothetical protein